MLKSSESEHLVSVLSDLVPALAAALPGSSEVVVHDLSRLPNSIVAVHGDVTGRKVGDPATDVLLEHLAREERDDGALVGYTTELPGGERLRSSTVVVRDRSGTPVAAVCVNSDLTPWHELAALAGSVIDPEGAPASAARQETFAHHVDDLAAQLVQDAVASVGVPVALMKKQHKVAVVAQLHGRGFFLLRDAAETAAEALEVTRYTVYNYLNELPGEASTDSESGPATGS